MLFFVSVQGTTPDSIDVAENRFKFSHLLDQIHVLQPEWKELVDFDTAYNFCDSVGYPCLVRSSYVRSGNTMRIVYNVKDLKAYWDKHSFSKEHPIIISKFISDAKELDIDAVACRGEVVRMVLNCIISFLEYFLCIW